MASTQSWPAHLGNLREAFADVLLISVFESDWRDPVGAAGYLALAGSDFGDDFVRMSGSRRLSNNLPSAATQVGRTVDRPVPLAV